jgi:hypothetical protein
MKIFNALVEVISEKTRVNTLNRIKKNKEKLNNTQDPEKRKILQNKIQMDTIRLNTIDLQK